MTALIIVGTVFALLSLVGVLGIVESNRILNEEYRSETNA